MMLALMIKEQYDTLLLILRAWNSFSKSGGNSLPKVFTWGGFSFVGGDYRSYVSFYLQLHFVAEV